MKRIITVIITIFAASLILAADQKITNDMKFVNQGKEMESEGNYEQAIVAFEKAIYANPENFYAFESSGKLYLKMGDKESALDYLYRAYDLNPNPDLKKLTEELSEKTYGFQALNFYPFTFDVFGGLGAVYYGSTVISFIPFSLNFNLGASVLYHFNNTFALKTGILYVPSGIDTYKVSYLDIPVAAVLKLGSKSSSKSALAAGMYFGPKIEGTFGENSSYSDSDIPGTDLGLHAGYHIYNLFGKFGFVYGFTLQHSLIPVHPEIKANSTAFMFNIGASF